MANKPRGVPVTPSGEGERRAQRGYQQQYAASAPFVYSGLKNDELEWVGVADRKAGYLMILFSGWLGALLATNSSRPSLTNASRSKAFCWAQTIC